MKLSLKFFFIILHLLRLINSENVIISCKNQHYNQQYQYSPQTSCDIGEYKRIESSDKSLFIIGGINTQITTVLRANNLKIEFLPSNLSITFPNLIEIFIISSELKKISYENVQNLSKLQFLDLNDNKIETLERNLFIDNPEMKMISMSFNEIKKIEPGTFTGLINLSFLNLDRNVCINQSASNREKVVEMIKTFIVKCEGKFISKMQRNLRNQQLHNSSEYATQPSQYSAYDNVETSSLAYYQTSESSTTKNVEISTENHDKNETETAKIYHSTQKSTTESTQQNSHRNHDSMGNSIIKIVFLTLISAFLLISIIFFIIHFKIIRRSKPQTTTTEIIDQGDLAYSITKLSPGILSRSQELLNTTPGILNINSEKLNKSQNTSESTSSPKRFDRVVSEFNRQKISKGKNSNLKKNEVLSKSDTNLGRIKLNETKINENEAKNSSATDYMELNHPRKSFFGLNQPKKSFFGVIKSKIDKNQLNDDKADSKLNNQRRTFENSSDSVDYLTMEPKKETNGVKKTFNQEKSKSESNESNPKPNKSNFGIFQSNQSKISPENDYIQINQPSKSFFNANQSNTDCIDNKKPNTDNNLNKNQLKNNKSDSKLNNQRRTIQNLPDTVGYLDMESIKKS